jgi:hypothetical protein
MTGDNSLPRPLMTYQNTHVQHKNLRSVKKNSPEWSPIWLTAHILYLKVQMKTKANASS